MSIPARPTSSLHPVSQAAKRRRGGRPRAKDPRTAISVHLSSEERKKLADDAAAAGMRLTPFIRERALHARPPRIAPSINRRDWAELARLAGNIRQIAGAIAAGRVQVVADDVASLLASTDARVRDLRLALLAADREDDE